jgi:hypothetical protein
VAYADDVTLVATGDTFTTACLIMQSFLNIVNQWSVEYGLTISPAKCYAMFISPKVKTDATIQASLYIGEAQLPIVTSMRILGVTFTNDLSWHVHSNAIRKKISSMTVVIQRFEHTLNIDCRKKLIHAFVTPHIR